MAVRANAVGRAGVKRVPICQIAPDSPRMPREAKPPTPVSTPQPSPALVARGMHDLVPQPPMMSPMLMPQVRRNPTSPTMVQPLGGFSPLDMPRLNPARYGASPLSTAGPLMSVSPMNRVGASPHAIQGSPCRTDDITGGRLPVSPVVAYVNYMPPPLTPEGEYIPAPVGQARERCNCARTKCDTKRCK